MVFNHLMSNTDNVFAAALITCIEQMIDIRRNDNPNASDEAIADSIKASLLELMK